MKAELIEDSHPEYLARPEIGRGRIVSELENTPKKARHDELVGTETTDPMRLGSAAHCAAFEPDRFHEDYTLFDGRKAGKLWTEAKEAHPLGEDFILKFDKYTYCLELQAALKECRKYQILVKGMQHEVSVYWDGKKARFDGYSPGLVMDLKTARDLSDHGIETALTKSNMIQMPHYIEAAAAVEGNVIDWQAIESLEGLPEFIFVFVSKVAPIEVRLAQVPFEHIKEAAMHRQLAIDSILENRKRNVYPTYSDTIETFSPKPWIYK